MSMVRRTGFGLLLLGGFLLLGGCASQLDRIETGIQTNRDEISRLEAQNKHLQQEVRTLSELVRMQHDSGDQTGAMGMAKLTQLGGRLEQVLQKLEDNAEFMRNLSARVDLLVNRSGIPTLGEYRPPSEKQQGGADLPEEGRTILDAADLDRTSGNNNLAREGYEEFLNRFDNTEAAARALYGLGDLDLDAGRFEAALARFDELLQRFPDNPRAPAALYKSRRCLLGLDRTAEAAARARRLFTEYPQAPEAALLKEELKSQD